MKTRTQEILNITKSAIEISSGDIYKSITSEVSYATVKRTIKKLVAQEYLISTGKGKGTKYSIAPTYDLLRPVDVDAYYEQELDDRDIIANFNLDLIQDVLGNHNLFTSDEILMLNEMHTLFTQNISELSEASYKQEFERLAIDLSWKSSQIEGNTYSLLETERLLKEKETAVGKTKEEAVMLLNHKETLDFILENEDYLSPLSISKIEDIHSLLIKELAVDRNLRKRRVGISGTNYRPLDNEYQIREALEAMCAVINHKKNVFEKALLALVLISYIQPFMDGNKRTARIVSNALLMNDKYCPLSFRTVDSVAYKKAMLLFYEQNNISIFKQIFIEQYAFAVQTYF